MLKMGGRYLRKSLMIISLRNQTKDVSLKGDELLGDLMNELHSGPSDMPVPKPVKLTKRTLVQQPARSPHMPFSTRPVKVPKPSSSGDNTVKVKGRPKPFIKTEPMDETPDIEEYNSQSGDMIEEGKENVAENFEDLSGMVFQDDDFNEEENDIKLAKVKWEPGLIKQEPGVIKQEPAIYQEPMTSLKMKAEKM